MKKIVLFIGLVLVLPGCSATENNNVTNASADIIYDYITYPEKLYDIDGTSVSKLENGVMYTLSARFDTTDMDYSFNIKKVKLTYNKEFLEINTERMLSVANFEEGKYYEVNYEIKALKLVESAQIYISTNGVGTSINFSIVDRSVNATLVNFTQDKITEPTDATTSALSFGSVNELNNSVNEDDISSDIKSQLANFDSSKINFYDDYLVVLVIHRFASSDVKFQKSFIDEFETNDSTKEYLFFHLTVQRYEDYNTRDGIFLDLYFFSVSREHYGHENVLYMLSIL